MSTLTYRTVDILVCVYQFRSSSKCSPRSSHHFTLTALCARLFLFNFIPRAWVHDDPGGLLEHGREVLLGERAALYILLCADVSGERVTVDRKSRAVVLLPPVDLCADEEHGCVGEVLTDLGNPLRPAVVPGVLGVDGEAKNDDVGLIRQRQFNQKLTFIFRLTRSVRTHFDVRDFPDRDVIFLAGEIP
jgi:hypothetical protein